MWKTPNPIFLKPNLINKENIIKSFEINKININKFNEYTINNNLYFHILYFLIFIIGILFLIYKYKEKKKTNNNRVFRKLSKPSLVSKKLCASSKFLLKNKKLKNKI
jgi:hypothetical protein